MDKVTGIYELAFPEQLHDQHLLQLNNTPTRGNNILDLVVTNAPEHVSVTQILSSEETSILQTIIPSPSISTHS